MSQEQETIAAPTQIAICLFWNLHRHFPQIRNTVDLRTDILHTVVLVDRETILTSPYFDLLSDANNARARLQLAISSLKSQRGAQTVPSCAPWNVSASRLPLPADVVVTPSEVNELHGTGILLLQMFPNSESIVSLRAHDFYQGKAVFGAAQFCLGPGERARSQIFATVLEWLRDIPVRRVLCCPYGPQDVLMAIAVKEMFGVPLCTYIMDDHNICAQAIPDSLMHELIIKSDLRLVISPEMLQAYAAKYRTKFWLLPPLVPAELVRSVVAPEAGTDPNRRRGVLVGNVWSQRWLELLRHTFRSSGYEIDWYCNHKNPSFLRFDRADLSEAGIHMRDPLSPEELAERLPSYGFAVVTSGTLDEHNTPSHQAIAELSLPSRIPFILATSHLPILVLGSAQTAAARCVELLNVGVSSSYTTSGLQAALAHLLHPEIQTAIRARAASLASRFSAEGAADWIWNSLDGGEPCDRRYEELMPVRAGEFAYYVDRPVPAEIHPDFHEHYRAFRRLRDLGYEPQFVVDAGASTGIWSYSISRLFPNARFILIDPLMSRYEGTQHCISNIPICETVEMAVSDHREKTRFKVSANLYCSSLIHLDDHTTMLEEIEVETTRLDALAEEMGIQGRGIVKIDVQHAEHLVIAGGRSLIANQADIVVLELSLIREDKDAKTLTEMLQVMQDLGFRYFDDAGNWRSPITGLLEQKDILFARSDLF